MDNDAKMLEQMGDALTALQIKYRASSLPDRMLLKPSLEELLRDYSKFQLALLTESVITNENDLKEMADIKRDIDQAAQVQQLALAIAKTIAFIATKV